MTKKDEKVDIGGGATREYFDSRWDSIKDKDGNQYWRDKQNHVTHKDDSSLIGVVLDNQIGERTDAFDDSSSDSMWEDNE